MTTHVIGGGLAGLSAATELAEEAGGDVILYEAASAAGGRCRSYLDRALGMRIDNGNHLLLSGNSATMRFLDRIGSRSTLGGPGVAHFPFHDLEQDETWSVEPGAGRIPWRLLRRKHRIPGSKMREYCSLLALHRAGPEATVFATLGHAGKVYERLIEPLAIAALNTRAEVALARLLWAVVTESLLLGAVACVPSFPRIGLSESFVDPALTWLRARGARVRLGCRVTALITADERVEALVLPDEVVPVAPTDAVVLAVPAWIAAGLLPGLTVPDAFESILNVHFRTEAEVPEAWRVGGFVGLLGSTAEWLFAKPGVLSVTISAANRLVDLPAEQIAARAWHDVRRACGLPEQMPPVRVLKERRATVEATHAQEQRRPKARSGPRNLALAGDWTATGLPGTIEGAIRSGRTAASVLREAA